MILITLYFAFLGATIASFLGVVVDRLPKKKSFVSGRSHCNVCNRDLSPAELIPIFSFVIQKGKCKACKTILPYRYLIIECIGAATFALSFLSFGFTSNFIVSLILSCLLIVISYIDIDTMLIYDRFNILMAILALLNLIFGNITILDSLMGALIISVPVGIFSILTGAIGFGDVKLLLSSGLLLGLRLSIVGFVIAILIGGLYAAVLLIGKKVNKKTAIPFGPFICIGIFIAYLYGFTISNWYLGLII